MQEGDKDANLEHVQELFVKSLLDNISIWKSLIVQDLYLVLLDKKWNGHSVKHLLKLLFLVIMSLSNAVDAT